MKQIIDIIWILRCGHTMRFSCDVSCDVARTRSHRVITRATLCSQGDVRLTRRHKSRIHFYSVFATSPATSHAKLTADGEISNFCNVACMQRRMENRIARVSPPLQRSTGTLEIIWFKGACDVVRTISHLVTTHAYGEVRLLGHLKSRTRLYI